MEALYDYLTSPQFALKLKAVYETFSRMREELEARLQNCHDEAERTKLVDAYNGRVRRMNIRFRRIGLYSESDSSRRAR